MSILRGLPGVFEIFRIFKGFSSALESEFINPGLFKDFKEY